MLLDPPDKLLDRYRILEREAPAKSASVALGLTEKRDIHGTQCGGIFGISGALGEPVVVTAVQAIEGGVRRINRHARRCKFQKGRLKWVGERERRKGFENCRVVRHDKCYRGIQCFFENSGGKAGQRRQS